MLRRLEIRHYWEERNTERDRSIAATPHSPGQQAIWAKLQASQTFVKVMIFLIDHNLEGQALILLGNMAAERWLDLLPIRFVKFKEIGLPIDSSDQTVWRFAQAKQLSGFMFNTSYLW